MEKIVCFYFLFFIYFEVNNNCLFISKFPFFIFTLNIKLYIHTRPLFIFQITFQQRFAKHNLEKQDLECLKELNITADFIVNSFDVYNFLQEGNSQLNEFVACSWKKSGYLNENSSLNADEIKTWLERDLIRALGKENMTVNEIIDPCKNVTGRNVGDTAIKVYNCMNRNLLGF